MKIYELIKEVNKKVSIKDKKVMSVKRYYLSMYRAYMMYMYDEGYISDPTSFNEKEVLQNVVDLGIPQLFGVSGKIHLSEEFISFAKDVNKNDEEKTRFLELLYEVVKYRNICLNLDMFYDDSGFTYESSKKVSLNIVQGASRITNKNGFRVDEGVLKCFHYDKPGFEFISLNELIYDKAVEELGISDDSGNSLFVKGLTAKEEAKYASIILNGLVRLDGQYANVLEEWLSNNKWSEENRFSSQKEGLYNWIVFIKSSDMIELQSQEMNRVLDSGYSIVCMESNGFWVVSKDVKEVNFPVGMFTVLGDDDSILPRVNMLQGYTGEVFSVYYLESEGLEYVGCPVELYVDNRKKEFFVDREQTELKDNISWFAYNDASISFSESFYKSGVFTENSLEDKIYNLVGNSESGELIGKLSNEYSESEIESAKKAIIQKKILKD